MLKPITNMQDFNKKAKRLFIDIFYNGSTGEYRKARKADYCKVQYEWTVWLDGLLKDGEITQKQWNEVVF